jgi:Zn-finger nucleic acid-binding protein
MNCPNCGAPMVLLEGRPVWHCDHCDTVVRPAGVPEGVRVVNARDDDARSCPVCGRSLRAAILDDRARIDVCERCSGILIQREVFAETLMARRRAAVTPAIVPSPVDADEMERRVACPSCAKTMITDWYYGPGHVIIDRCVRCDLVWLDGGEFKTLVDAPGLDRPL